MVVFSNVLIISYGPTRIFVIPMVRYSGTSISGGAGTANTLINPHSPVIHVQKRQNIIEYFCHLTVQTTKTVI